MSYKPTFPGEGVTAQWIFDELNRISAEMGRAHILTFDKLAVEPQRPRDGMVALANGSNWNPSGSVSSSDAAGLHVYLEGEWRRLMAGGTWMVNVRDDYGAAGDGVTDDTASVRAAISSGSQNIYFPPGNYLLTSSLTITAFANLSLIGFNALTTRLVYNQGGGDVLVSHAPFTIISGLGFQHSVSKSAGFTLVLNASECVVDRCFFEDFHDGIYTAGAVNRITDTELRDGTTGGIAIHVTGGDTSQVIDNCLIDSANSAHGIFTDDNSSLMVANTSVLQADSCLTLAPGSGQNIFSNKFLNCFFDTATTGVSIVPSATAGVYRTQFIGCWTGGMSDRGVTMVSNSPSNVDGIDFVSHECFNNTSDGFGLVGATVQNIQIRASRFCGNGGAGVSINSFVDSVRLSDNVFGPGFGLLENLVDVFVATPCAGIELHNNVFGSTSKVSTASSLIADGNNGYKTKATGAASLSAAATSVVVSTGLDRTPDISEISVTPIVGWGAMTQFWVSSISSSTFVINVSPAAGSDMYFSWAVDTDARNL